MQKKLRIIIPTVVTLCAVLLGGHAFAEPGADSFQLASPTNNNGGAQISNSTSTGFTLSYGGPVQDDPRSIVEIDARGLQLEEGRPLEISFTLSSGQVTPGGFVGWGFDFGNTIAFSVLTTGQPKYTFFQNRYDTASGFPFTMGTLANGWSVQNDPEFIPPAEAAITSGSSVRIVATLKRVEGADCEMKVEWGGREYVSHFRMTDNFALASIFFRFGDRTRTNVSEGDNFTISDFQLKEGGASE